MTAGWSGTTAGVAVCALLPLLSIGLAGKQSHSACIMRQAQAQRNNTTAPASYKPLACDKAECLAPR